MVQHRRGAHRGHQRARPPGRGLIERDQRGDRHRQQEVGGDQVRVAAFGEAVVRAGEHKPGQRRRAEPELPSPEPGGQRVRAQRGDHHEHGSQHGKQLQRRQRGEPGDDRGQRGEARRVDQVAVVLAVGEHLLGHDRVRERVTAADVGPVVLDHAGVGAQRGQREHDRQPAVPDQGQGQPERPLHRRRPGLFGFGPGTAAAWSAADWCALLGLPCLGGCWPRRARSRYGPWRPRPCCRPLARTARCPSEPGPPSASEAPPPPGRAGGGQGGRLPGRTGRARPGLVRGAGPGRGDGPGSGEGFGQAISTPPAISATAMTSSTASGG